MYLLFGFFVQSAASNDASEFLFPVLQVGSPAKKISQLCFGTHYADADNVGKEPVLEPDKRQFFTMNRIWRNHCSYTHDPQLITSF